MNERARRGEHRDWRANSPPIGVALLFAMSVGLATIIGTALI
jgi:FlaG/FlaF family flagellin (archaellin)